MTPAELLDDHARRPRNVGKLLNASAVGDVGSIVVGDALRFYISVDGAGKRISQAKFQVFNCTDQVGASSALTELVVGRPLAECRQLGHGELARHLGGLDHALLPAQLWAVVGLQAAIGAYLGEGLEPDEELDPLLCRCYAIAEETVRTAVAVHGCASVEEVVTATGAGTGCGSCRNDIPRLIDEVLRKPAAPPPPALKAGPVGRIQTLLRIQRLVAAKLLPGLGSAAGDIELWDFDGKVVRVRWAGSLGRDQAARAAALTELAQLIKAEIDPTIAVDDSG
jgi:NifU-like protein